MLCPLQCPAFRVVLVAQAVEDAFCGVALFLRTFLIVWGRMKRKRAGRPLRWLAPPIAQRSEPATSCAPSLAIRPNRLAAVALTEPFEAIETLRRYLSV